MTAPIIINRLDKGYLIQRGNDRGSFDSLAGLSNAYDLCEWIAVWSGEDINVVDASGAVEKINTDAETDIAPDASEPVIIPEETLAQEPQEADFETEQPKHRQTLSSPLTDMQERVLAHIEYCATKHGPRFQIEMKTLADKAQVNRGSIYYHLDKLAEHGLIVFEKQHNGQAPFITLCERKGEAA